LTMPDGSLPEAAWWAGVPVGALTTCILVIDDIRDRAFDADKGEVTLAVLLGERGSRVEFLGLMGLAYAVPIGFWLSGSGGGVLLPLASLPYAALVARRLWVQREREDLIPVTPQAGQVLLLFSSLFAVGLAFGR